MTAESIDMTKILIVEDNELNRDMLRRRLERNGYDVECAVDGPQGIAMAIEGQPNCWARVGCSNVRSNQSRTGALKVVRGSLLTPAIYSRARM